MQMQPHPNTIRVIQDKFAQKQHFAAAGVPLPEFRDIKCRGCMEATARAFGFPFMLKSKRLAYDGKGNAVVRDEAAMDAAVEALGGYAQGLYAEKWAPFVKELAVMVVRSRDGQVVSYPVVETIHKDSICHVTESPAEAPPQALAAAQACAERAIACLQGAGIFGVEMFLLADGSILLNEVAPRPHNSGHYTQDGCQTSQFENHIRAVLGWPLGNTQQLAPCSIMLNLLGEEDGEEGVRRAHDVMARAYLTPGTNVHWYGKDGMKKGRKVGHININGGSRAEARARLAALDPAAAASLTRSSHALAAAQGEAGSQQPSPQVGIIMGSDSDLATMKAAAQVLAEFDIPCEITVVSAHRTPQRMMDYARSAHTRGLKAIIAGAGGAAHLPGMVAAMTPLPVIGVPVKPAGAYLDGLDALLSIVQMPKGVPVATVAIGNAANAGLLAVRILGAYDPALLEKMIAYQDGMRTMVLDKASKLEEQGWEAYKVATH
ncbi:ATP-grasp domain-containing protein [Haematococcus lacustris]|uniref:phosphoribosylaminoimidazole carboxylase n=1 Tax=Haematococcus lacustris TaxID=44745 RepID=A0A699YEX9_HAELA|nr:ATP-grasp domain-containing protein [Haematococcus lacustris]